MSISRLASPVVPHVDPASAVVEQELRLVTDWPQLSLLDWNEAAAAALGLREPAAYRLDDFVVLADEAGVSALSTLRRAESGQPIAVRLRLALSGGRPLKAEVDAYRLRCDPDRMQIRLRPAGTREAASRVWLYERIFNSTRDGIMVTDARGVIQEVNEAFTRVTGYSRAEAVGQTPRLLHSGRQDRAFYRAMWAQIAAQGYWHGEIWNRRKNGEVYPELLGISAVHDLAGAVSHYVSIFTDIGELKDTQRRLDRIAHFDALTDLPNRGLFHDRVAQAMRQLGTRSMMLVRLNLDRFGDVNQQLGMEAGDRLMVALAARLQAALQPEDTLARFSGNDFAILLIRSDVPLAMGVLAGLNPLIARPVMLDGHAVSLSASIGATIYPSDQADTASLLIRHAGLAMFAAKEAGGGVYNLFDAEQDRLAHEQRAREDDIRRGLAAGEFELFYQPKINMRSGTVLGLEALIRWRHPQRGLVPPAEFIPLAESSELIIELGRWVLAQTVAQLARWRREGLVLAVSVNIAARQLRQDAFLAELDALLAGAPVVEACQLELEILESAALDDIDWACDIIRACRARGMTVALDDFGTGYSSLAYLKKLPVDTVKIDQLFVRDLPDNDDDRAIVRGIVTMVEGFGRTLVAEGVESGRHMRLLRALGCELVQGYGIARPMPAAEVSGWVRGFRFDWPAADDEPEPAAGATGPTES